MRLVKQIPHDRLLIQVHQYNGKYILKIELSGFEQIFKIPENEVNNLDLLDSLIDANFISNCVKRFVDMRNDWMLIQQKLS
jgi:hypothetical protein